jgi:hypothetical protein
LVCGLRKGGTGKEAEHRGGENIGGELHGFCPGGLSSIRRL